MKRKPVRKEQVFIATLAVFFVIGLIGVHAAWPKAFGVFIAIGGTAGALMVLYEVRLTKQIAQAEFIRELQSSYSTDPRIGELWNKLLLGETITSADRALMSNYLTFFETLHLLQKRGALDLELADELFRNRFFTAIGNRDILRTTLMKDPSSFGNIHALVAAWHAHLLEKGKPIHPGYYTYIEELSFAKGYELVELGPEDLDDLLALQQVVLSSLENKPWLRENAPEMFAECLAVPAPGGPQHRVLGFRKDGELAAAGILFDGQTGDESIRGYFTDDDAKKRASINLKLVLADSRHRRAGLARTVVELLEREATAMGRDEVMCTIHPKNLPSQRLFGKLWYRRHPKRVATKYGPRLVFFRELHRVDVGRFR